VQKRYDYAWRRAVYAIAPEGPLLLQRRQEVRHTQRRSREFHVEAPIPVPRAKNGAPGKKGRSSYSAPEPILFFMPETTGLRGHSEAHWTTAARRSDCGPGAPRQDPLGAAHREPRAEKDGAAADGPTADAAAGRRERHLPQPPHKLRAPLSAFCPTRTPRICRRRTSYASTPTWTRGTAWRGST
jgi:hypothetical protein